MLAQLHRLGTIAAVARELHTSRPRGLDATRRARTRGGAHPHRTTRSNPHPHPGRERHRRSAVGRRTGDDRVEGRFGGHLSGRRIPVDRPHRAGVALVPELTFGQLPDSVTLHPLENPVCRHDFVVVRQSLNADPGIGRLRDLFATSAGRVAMRGIPTNPVSQE